jgi:ankyrin repeat protein
MILSFILVLGVFGSDRCGRPSDYNENTGYSALHRASLTLNGHCIKYLLDMGADANAVTLKVSSYFS